MNIFCSQMAFVAMRPILSNGAALAKKNLELVLAT